MVRVGLQSKLIIGTERYLQQLGHSKIKGYLFEQQNYIPEK